MKLAFETGTGLRRAMHAVRMMTLSENTEPTTTACRLVLPQDADTAKALSLQRYLVLRMRMRINTERSEPGELTLPATAVRSLCSVPEDGPVTIDGENNQIEAVIGRARRRACFRSPADGHETERCGLIIDEQRETSSMLPAGLAGEQLHGLGPDTLVCRVRIGPEGVHAWANPNADEGTRPDAMLSAAAAKGPPASFAINRRLLDMALRALTSRDVTLRTGGERHSTIELSADSGQIVLPRAESPRE